MELASNTVRLLVLFFTEDPDGHVQYPQNQEKHVPNVRSVGFGLLPSPTDFPFSADHQTNHPFIERKTLSDTEPETKAS